jgi:hypothetical protein
MNATDPTRYETGGTPMSLYSLCPNGAATRSPGLTLRLPWERGRRMILIRKAVASFASEKSAQQAQPRCGCEDQSPFSPG